MFYRWCDFVETNFPDKVLFHSTDALVQIPVGFRYCHQPFGRLLASFDRQYALSPDSPLNKPLRWLLERVNQENGLVQEVSTSLLSSTYLFWKSFLFLFFLNKAYFRDWLLLRLPPHLHNCAEQFPMARMKDILNTLFADPECFLEDWESHEAKVIAALELLNIASFAISQAVTWPNASSTQIRSWKVFIDSATRLSLAELSTPAMLQSQKKLLQSITSIEVNPFD